MGWLRYSVQFPLIYFSLNFVSIYPFEKQCFYRQACSTSPNSVLQAKQVSDLDREILKDLLEDQEFVESLARQNRVISPDLRKEIVDSQPIKSKEKQLLIGIDKSESFQSETFKEAAKLQDQFRSFIGGVQAAVESATLFVLNKAATDLKLLEATVDYVSRRANYDTRRALSAASSISRPLALLGDASEEARRANLTMGESVQLFGLGLFDGLGNDRRLGTLQSFDDPTRRLQAAYQRKMDKKPASLAYRAASALPEIASKTSDLVYEVKREIKYEKAGRKVGKVLNKYGVDPSFLISPAKTKQLRGERSMISAPSTEPEQMPLALRPTRNEAAFLPTTTELYEEEMSDTPIFLPQTYGEFLGYIETVLSEFETFRNISYVGFETCDDMRTLLSGLTSATQKAQTVLKDVNEIYEKANEEIVRQSLEEALEVKKKEIYLRNQIFLVISKTLSAFETWETGLDKMSAEFTNALQNLREVDSDLFNKTVEPNKPLPEKDKYISLIQNKLENQKRLKSSLLRTVRAATFFFNSQNLQAGPSISSSLHFLEDYEQEIVLKINATFHMLSDSTTVDSNFDQSFLCGIPQHKETASQQDILNKEMLPNYSTMPPLSSPESQMVLEQVIVDVGGFSTGLTLHDTQIDKGNSAADCNPVKEKHPTVSINSAIAKTYTLNSDSNNVAIVPRGMGFDNAIDIDAQIEQADSEKAVESVLKVFDITILLVEKLLSLGLPVLVDSSGVVTERLKAIYSKDGASSEGWQVLSSVKH